MSRSTFQVGDVVIRNSVEYDGFYPVRPGTMVIVCGVYDSLYHVYEYIKLIKAGYYDGGSNKFYDYKFNPMIKDEY